MTRQPIVNSSMPRSVARDGNHQNSGLTCCSPGRTPGNPPNVVYGLFSRTPPPPVLLAIVVVFSCIGRFPLVYFWFCSFVLHVFVRFCTKTKNLFAGLGVDAAVYELDQMGESPTILLCSIRGAAHTHAHRSRCCLNFFNSSPLHSCPWVVGRDAPALYRFIMWLLVLCPPRHTLCKPLRVRSVC